MIHRCRWRRRRRRRRRRQRRRGRRRRRRGRRRRLRLAAPLEAQAARGRSGPSLLVAILTAVEAILLVVAARRQGVVEKPTGEVQDLAIRGAAQPRARLVVVDAERRERRRRQRDDDRPPTRAHRLGRGRKTREHRQPRPHVFSSRLNMRTDC